MGNARTWASTLLLTALAGCQCDEPKAAPRMRGVIVAEHKSPRIAVRSYEDQVPSPGCSPTGLANLLCAFQTEQHTCSWLEVGAEVDSQGPVLVPVALRTRDHPCTKPAPSAQHARVDDRALRPGEVTITVDDDDRRIRIDETGVKDAWVFYLFEGELMAPEGSYRHVAGSPGLDRDPDGGPVGEPPAFREQVPNFLWSLEPGGRRRLLDEIRKREGEGAIGDLLLLRRGDSLDEPWFSEFERLPPAEQHAVLGVLEERLMDDDHFELQWFLEHPALQPAAFGDLLAAAVERSIGTGLSPPDGFLEELVRRRDRRAGPLACQILERSYGNHVNTGEYDSIERETPALGAIAALKTPCSTLGLLLELNPCNAELRCLAPGTDAGTPVDELDSETPERISQIPLCAVEQTNAEVESFLGDPHDVIDGRLLLAAARTQGALPAEFVLRNARRLYAIERPDGGAAARAEDADVAPHADIDDTFNPKPTPPIKYSKLNPKKILCKLRPSLTTVVLGDCRVTIDDKRRKVTVRQLVP